MWSVLLSYTGVAQSSKILWLLNENLMLYPTGWTSSDLASVHWHSEGTKYEFYILYLYLYFTLGRCVFTLTLRVSFRLVIAKKKSHYNILLLYFLLKNDYVWYYSKSWKPLKGINFFFFFSKEWERETHLTHLYSWHWVLWTPAASHTSLHYATLFSSPAVTALAFKLSTVITF